MIRLVVFCFVAFLIFIAATCERPVDLEIPVLNPKLVVVSNFTSAENLLVQVSETQSILDSNDVTYVTDATVELFQGNNLLEELSLVMGTGRIPPFYTTLTTTPKPGIEYMIRVDAPGFEPVMAQSSIPDRIDILNLEVSDLVITPGSNEDELVFSYNVNLIFEDPGAQANYYQLNFFQEVFPYVSIEGDTTIVGKDLRQINFSANSNNNNFIAYFDGGVLFDDANFNGSLISYGFRLQTSINRDTELLGQMFAELRSTSEEYYLFHNSLSRQQLNSNDPFSEPVIVFNNIENGKGIFAGYNQAVDSVLILQ
ncbi:MAG: DUF4249 domain-containing protein [Bacteroidota bacterium]